MEASWKLVTVPKTRASLHRQGDQSSFANSLKRFSSFLGSARAGDPFMSGFDESDLFGESTSELNQAVEISASQACEV
jgi:hypothetical protein